MTTSVLHFIANPDQFVKIVVRVGIVIAFLRIGGLKFFSYEANSIEPFIHYSPFISFFYNHPHDYQGHMNKGGELVSANNQWHRDINEHQGGLPFLSARGRLLIKDIIIPGGAIITMCESANFFLNKKITRSQIK